MNNAVKFAVIIKCHHLLRISCLLVLPEKLIRLYISLIQFIYLIFSLTALYYLASILTVVLFCRITTFL